MEVIDHFIPRSARNAIRAQIAALRTVSPREAEKAGAIALTRPYQLRQAGQCLALLNVVRDFAACPNRILIVRVGDGELEVWKKADAAIVD